MGGAAWVCFGLAVPWKAALGAPRMPSGCALALWTGRTPLALGAWAIAGEVLLWHVGVPLLVGAIGVRVLQELVRGAPAQSR